MKAARMITISAAPFILAWYLLGFAESAAAQRSGQVVSVQYGVVTSGQRVDLQSSAVPAGAVVGGTLMTGGFGSVIGVAFGAVTVGLVANAVFFIPWIDGSWFRVFLGGILLAAVFANERIRKRITGGI